MALLVRVEVCTYTVGLLDAGVYNVSAGDDRAVGSLTLTRATYRPGDIVVGTFDFSKASTKCYQVCIRLMYEETVLTRKSGAVTGGRAATTVASHNELTGLCESTSFSLGIPMELPPAFIVANIGLAWSLSFEFSIARSSGVEHDVVDDSMVDSVSWRVPLMIVQHIADVERADARRPGSLTKRSSSAPLADKVDLPWHLSPATRKTTV